ncbi:hypothetical protein F511_26779 [Dorcoceras hygrometricum]|uniref:Uncharacterized protein n=1 Tax=Dorcoceras hygrometricum TaxID=472368 RepID=A0A2Z7CUA0_9LAMI|nr:hypothetical protein F511_26779 [Dorcoceras hygrometricum]
MVHEYRKLSQTFEEIKSENNGLKNSSVEPSTAQLGETDILQTELSKLKIKNEYLITKSCELSSENERLNHVMSSLTKSSVFLSCPERKVKRCRFGLIVLALVEGMMRRRLANIICDVVYRISDLSFSNPYCSSNPIYFDCRRFMLPFGARLVALGSSSLDLSIDTSLET